MVEYKCHECVYAVENSPERMSCSEYRKSLGIYKPCWNDSEFKPIQEKEMKTKKYELTKRYKRGIALCDIADAVTTVCEKDNFLNLYKEVVLHNLHPGATNISLSVLLELKTIQNNKAWLVEKGFIQEKNKAFHCYHCDKDVAEVHKHLGCCWVKCSKKDGGCGAMSGDFKTEREAVKNWRGVT